MATNDIFTSNDYEHDDRWTAVDAYSTTHLHSNSPPSLDVLNRALETIRKNGMPDDSTYPAFGKYLALQCRSAGANHVLEVGALGGYTAIWIATLNPNVKITTLEVNPKHVEVARQNLNMAGVSDRVEIILGPGVETLARLRTEVEAGQRPRFGFVFIDADKENNWPYFDFAVGMSLPGTLIYVDNVVRKGNLVNEQMLHTGPVQGSRKVIEEAGKDNRVDCVVIQTVGEKNYDGFLLALVK
ncbi:O-methyltransferase-domain-containing protein [Xylaria cf. heliscus]|nr:O-methyltransferase-domain-containing protein [Xylaria cf. heliscus]